MCTFLMCYYKSLSGFSSLQQLSENSLSKLVCVITVKPKMQYAGNLVPCCYIILEVTLIL